MSAAGAGLGVAPPSPAPPNSPRQLRGWAGGSPSSRLAVQTPRPVWGRARVLGSAGPGRWGLGWSQEAPPAPGSSGRLQLSFAGNGGQAPSRRPRSACSLVPMHSPGGLLSPAVLPPPCCPCCPCAFVGCGPAALPPGSSQRPPGSGESVAGAGAFPEVPCVFAEGPALGAELLGSVRCLAASSQVASPSLLRTPLRTR